jgi:hypothetical protein
MPSGVYDHEGPLSEDMALLLADGMHVIEW